MDIFDKLKAEFEAGLLALHAKYGDDYCDWPFDHRDADVQTRHLDRWNFQREVLVDGLAVGWVSRMGGHGKPVQWHAYFRQPGDTHGKPLYNDPSKLRYAVQDIVHEAWKRATKAAGATGTVGGRVRA